MHSIWPRWHGGHIVHEPERGPDPNLGVYDTHTPHVLRLVSIVDARPRSPNPYRIQLCSLHLFVTPIFLISPLFLFSSLLCAYARSRGRWSLGTVMCTCVRRFLSLSGYVLGIPRGSVVSVPALEHECWLLTLISSLYVWSHRTVAVWRGLRMRPPNALYALLRHGHMFGAHCPNFRVFYYAAINMLSILFHHRRGRRD